MAQFASQSLALGSPLCTLYSLFAGANTAVFDAASVHGAGGGGDALAARWRHNLAIMMANPTAGDTDVISQLGDQLWRTDGVAAAHSCYVLAECALELAQHGAELDETRLLVVGHDHRTGGVGPSVLQLQTTELYAYCRAMANPEFCATALPPAWLLYAYQLSDLGKLEQAAAYMGLVAGAIEASGASAWSPAFLAHANTLRQLLKARGLAPRATPGYAPPPPAAAATQVVPYTPAPMMTYGGAKDATTAKTRRGRRSSSSTSTSTSSHRRTWAPTRCPSTSSRRCTRRRSSRPP